MTGDGEHWEQPEFKQEYEEGSWFARDVGYEAVAYEQPPSCDHASLVTITDYLGRPVRVYCSDCGVEMVDDGHAMNGDGA